MIFKDRIDAGKQLANQLTMFADRGDVVVLGLPRGGVPVAREVANALHAPLDVFLSRKLGVPGNEELAFGAVSTGGGHYFDQRTIRAVGLTQAEVETVTVRARGVLEQRERLYRGNREPAPVDGKIVILVDDGLATGASVTAAVRALRDLGPKKIVVAAPVAPAETCMRLRKEVDSLVVLQTPQEFHAVGQFYEDFGQTSDAEVVAALRRSNEAPRRFTRECAIPFPGFSLPALLTLTPGSDTIVVFAHGSGSSRLSRRNQFVATFLNRNGISTLLFDLLTMREEREDVHTGALRFDIDLLANRVFQAVEWLRHMPETAHMKIVLFGASTGAAAALRVAARLGDSVCAVISRGGRPDLAGEELSRVLSPTLLIVGGHDETVEMMNREAMQRMKCVKRLVLVPGATHLFNEPGALETVADSAFEWIRQWSRSARPVECTLPQ